MTPLPLPATRTWLEYNYRLYSNYHLCQKLGIGQRQLTIWFKNLNLSKRMNKKVLTPGQERIIKDNFLVMTHQQIADMIGDGINVGHVQRYCFHNNLKKTGKNKQYLAEKVVKAEAPAEYSSGYEATIEKYIKKEI